MDVPQHKDPMGCPIGSHGTTHGILPSHTMLLSYYGTSRGVVDVPWALTSHGTSHIPLLSYITRFWIGRPVGCLIRTMISHGSFFDPVVIPIGHPRGYRHGTSLGLAIRCPIGRSMVHPIVHPMG